MKAIVKRVVDGDTIIVDIYIGAVIVLPIPNPLGDTYLGVDLYADPNGVLVMRKVRIRLYKFYAAEMGTVDGVMARDRLLEALPIGTEITLELHGKDKYGRWLAVPSKGCGDLYLSLTPELCPKV